MGEKEDIKSSPPLSEESITIKKSEACIGVWEETMTIPDDIPQGEWTAADSDEKYCAGALNSDGVFAIYLWEQRSGKIVGECQSPERVTIVSLTPQATIVGFTTVSNTVVIQSIQKPSKRQYNIHLQHSKHSSRITQLCWGHNGLYSSDEDGFIFEFDWMTKFEPRLLSSIGEPIHNMISNTFHTREHTGVELLVTTSRRVLLVHQINGMIVTLLKKTVIPLGACFLSNRYTLIVLDKTIQLFDGVEAELLKSSVKKVNHEYTKPLSVSLLRNNYIALTDGERMSIYNSTFSSVLADYRFEGLGEGSAPCISQSKKFGFSILTSSTLYRIHSDQHRSPKRQSPTTFYGMSNVLAAAGNQSPVCSPRVSSQRRTLKEQHSLISSIAAAITVVTASPVSDSHDNDDLLSSIGPELTDLALPDAESATRRSITPTPHVRTSKKVKTLIKVGKKDTKNGESKSKIRTTKKSDKSKHSDVTQLVKLRDPMDSKTAKRVLKMSEEALQNHYEEKQAIIKVKSTQRAIVTAAIVSICSDWVDNIHQRIHQTKRQAITAAVACLLPISTVEVQKRIYYKDLHDMTSLLVGRVLNRVFVQIEILSSEALPSESVVEDSESDCSQSTSEQNPSYKLTGALLYDGEEEGGILWKIREYEESVRQSQEICQLPQTSNCCKNCSHDCGCLNNNNNNNITSHREDSRYISQIVASSAIAVVVASNVCDDSRKRFKLMKSLLKWANSSPIKEKGYSEDLAYQSPRATESLDSWKWSARVLLPGYSPSFALDVIESCVPLLEDHFDQMSELGCARGRQVVYETQRTSMWNSNWDEVLYPPEYQWSSQSGEVVFWNPIDDPDLLPNVTVVWDGTWHASQWEYSSGRPGESFDPVPGYFSVLRRRLWSREWCCPLLVQKVEELKRLQQQEVRDWSENIVTEVYGEGS